MFDTSQYGLDVYEKIGDAFLGLSLIVLKNICDNEGLLKRFASLKKADRAIIDFIVDYVMFLYDLDYNEMIDLAEKGGLKDMLSLGERLM